MSRVFSAKRKEVSFEYEFLDESKVTLVSRSLSSKEQVKVAKMMREDPEAVVENFDAVVKMQLAKNDESIVQRVIEEQYESGDIVNFSNAIGSLIKEAKEKK